MTMENTSHHEEDLLEAEYDLPTSANAFLKPIDPAYYRSKIVTTDASINPLMNAAAPLFSLASKIKTLKNPPNLLSLHNDLCHEIKAFETKAQAENYVSYTLLAARYMLCAFLDEMILTTAWGKESHWQVKNLLSHFHHENDEGEKFFMLLERAVEDSKAHIDLLELVYLCLSLDYQGKYRHTEHGSQELAEMRDQLYKLICMQRGEFTSRFSLTPETANKTRKNIFHFTSFFSGITITCLALIVVYTSFNFALGMQAQAFYQTLDQLQNFSGIFS